MRMFDGADAVALGSYQSALSSAADSLKNHLQEQTGRLAWDDFSVAGLGAIAGQVNQSAGRFFKRNWRYLWAGVLISSTALFAGLFEHHRWAASGDSREIVGMAIAALIFTPFGAYLLVLCWRTWRSFLAAVKYSQLIGLLIGSALFVGGAAMPGALWVLMYQREPALTLLIFALLSTNLLFIWLLPAPTALGRQLLDQIAGFRRFLAATEEERLQLLHPPERTPQLFERFLPHAIALGCANAWAEQFTGTLAAAALAPGRSDAWYSDMTTGGRMGDIVGLSSSLSSTVAGAISAAATAPGTSGGGGGGDSGDGGGGSSGGGGGGGGGGGW